MKTLKGILISIATTISFTSAAEEVSKATERNINLTGEELLVTVFGITAFGVVLLALLFCVYFIYALNAVLNPVPDSPKTKKEFSLTAWLNEKFGLGKLKPIEEEAEIALDHSYDGIVELDNGMPPWLRYLFSATIVFAAIYLINYLVLDNGLNQTQEYEQELALAEKESEQRKLLALNSIDETNVTLLTDKAEVETGKVLYDQNCKACHGGLGEGGVGPNLTDAYWIHGGKINDIFKTIKYGVPEKGMIAWQAKLKPVEIQKVSSYILSIKDTNPPNAKGPQGDLFEEERVPVLK